MKNIFRSLLYSAMVLVAGFAASCTENEEGTGGYQGIPTIKVTPASLNVALAGGTTEQVVVETPAEWTLEIDTEGVVASAMSGNGDAVITFEVPAAEAMRTIKATFTATGYVSGYPITKKASVSISQSDSDIPAVGGAFVYYEDGGESVSKVDGYWPYVDKYTGWNPQGGEGFDQSGVTYTGKNASVRNSGKSWAPVGATYATDAPYAYLQAKDGVEFIIHNINIKSGVKNYTFSFTAHNQYANESASPYAPAPVSPLKSGENLTVEVSVDGTNFGAITFSTMADGNWEYAIAPFTLPADADKLFVRFSNYKADTTTPLPSTAYQYQAALRFDDFRLVEGGNGPVVDFNNAIGGGNTGGGNVPTEAVKATVAEFLAAAEDGTTYYELTGVISNVTNTTYGNFDLTDSTGTVLIYGLCSPTGEQKYWAESGAKSGDTITVRTLRTSYNNTPQGKDAIFVSLVPGEGGDEPTPEPAEGIYASDVPFVCAADDSTNAAYSLAATTINGQAATGFKLGKSKQQGKFTSTAIGVSGTKYINFYAAAWKGTTATLYFRVDGGAVQSVALAGNTGATGNPPYPITFADSDHYSVKLEGLTEASTIEFGTNADLALTTHSGKAPDIAPRVIVCGVKLSDEPLGTDNPGGTTPEPEPDPTPSQTVAINTITADGTYTVEGIVVAVAAKAYVIADQTGSLLVYGAEHGRTLMEKVTIEGTVSRYKGYNTNSLQMAATTTTVVSTDNTYEYKPLVVDGATLDAMVGADAACIEVQVTGVISVGSYANITVEGATKQASLYYVNTADYAAFNGKNVVVKGYVTGTYNYLNILPYSVTEVGGSTPTPDPEPTPTPGEAKTLPYAESFTTSQGDFTINNVTLGTLSYVWQHATYNSDGYMKASAFMDNAAVVAESWLVSPAISLAGATSPVVTFTHAHKFAGTPSEELTLWVSANDGAWEQVTIPTYSNNSSWTFVESGEISLAKYVGSTVKVAFKYVSTASKAGTWEVKNFSVAEASGAVTPDPTPEPEPTPGTGTTVSAALNASLTWTEETDATYGKGFYTTVDGVKMGYYQGTSTTTPVAAKDDHIRVYKSSLFVVVPPAGQKVKNVNINVTYAATYALNMTVEGADNAVGNKDNGTITWSGSVDKFVATASEGQVRIKDISVVIE